MLTSKLSETLRHEMESVEMKNIRNKMQHVDIKTLRERTPRESSQKWNGKCWHQNSQKLSDMKWTAAKWINSQKKMQTVNIKTPDFQMACAPAGANSGCPRSFWPPPSSATAAMAHQSCWCCSVAHGNSLGWAAQNLVSTPDQAGLLLFRARKCSKGSWKER